MTSTAIPAEPSTEFPSEKVQAAYLSPETVLQTPDLEPKQVLDLETSQAPEPAQAMEIFPEQLFRKKNFVDGKDGQTLRSHWLKSFKHAIGDNQRC